MKLTLLKRMIVYILLPAIVGLVSLAFMAGYVAKIEFTASNDRQLEELARVQANELDNILVYISEILESSATNQSFVDLVNDAKSSYDNIPTAMAKDKAEAALKKLSDSYRDLTAAYITGTDGILLAHSASILIGADTSTYPSTKDALSNQQGFESRIGRTTNTFSAYMTVPIKENNTVIGVLGFIIDYSALQRHTTEALSLTDSMRAYVYDSDFTILMDNIVDFVSTSDADYDFTKAYIGKDKGVNKFTFDGVESYAHFARVESMDWIVVIDTPVAELDAPVNDLIKDILLFAAAIVGIVSVVIFFVAKNIADVMREGASVAAFVAAGNMEIEPQLAAKMAKTIERGDEIADLAINMGIMIDNIGKMFKESQEATASANKALAEAEIAQQEAKEAAERASQARREGLLEAGRELEGVVHVVASASEQLSAQIETTSRSVADQANRLNEAAGAMEQMNETIVDVARNAVSSAETSDITKEKAVKGVEITQKCKDTMNQVREESLALRENMATLADHAQSINTVMGVITDIADQTNLLALNAAIEAARAGEAGRGFAVVADEVRKLAEKTITSTSDVAQAISAIQHSTEENVKQVDVAVKVIEEATDLANLSGEALQDILEMAEQSAGGIRSIATASEEQSATVEEMNTSIERINSIAHETKNAMGEASQAVVSLSNQAQELTAIVENLKNN